MPSQPMTIPHQEGGIINSQDSWYMTGTPSKFVTVHHTPTTTTAFQIMRAVSDVWRTFADQSPFSLRFILRPSFEPGQGLRRNDVEAEIVNKTLS
ncbi:hypothetical protein DPMN_099782 [Dreissena polymorpha]|uniref:Uncharacterized protein n=1 Tax=Dreissena polymorpha TaxID=45954 RepID=A0A9D4LEP1_DREPO|nr:hypothetical protein DPMN_099782 [Dreissena polymorpha]